jgi:hypothetical protein
MVELCFHFPIRLHGVVPVLVGDTVWTTEEALCFQAKRLLLLLLHTYHTSHGYYSYSISTAALVGLPPKKSVCPPYCNCRSEDIQTIQIDLRPLTIPASIPLVRAEAEIQSVYGSIQWVRFPFRCR